ncbi:hypothetical protein ES703_71739 [subsurface metagenome]
MAWTASSSFWTSVIIWTCTRLSESLRDSDRARSTALSVETAAASTSLAIAVSSFGYLDFRVCAIAAKSGDTDKASAGRLMVSKTMSSSAAQTKTLLKAAIKTKTDSKTEKNSIRPKTVPFSVLNLAFISHSPFSLYFLQTLRNLSTTNIKDTSSIYATSQSSPDRFS